MSATEARLAAYAAENATSIARNSALAKQEHSSLEEMEAAQREISRLDREAARKEEEDEKRAREANRRDLIQQIADGKGDPEELARQSQKVILKKSTARRTAADKVRLQQHVQDVKQVTGKELFGSNTRNGTADPSFTIKGLKAVVVEAPVKPYDPFGGMNMESSYYTLQDYYENSWLDKARADPQINAGGYDLKEYYARTMLEAYSGLCCFISDEKIVNLGLDDLEAIGTEGAAVAATEQVDPAMYDSP